MEESSHLSSQCCHVQLSGHVVKTSNLIEFQSQEKRVGKKGVDNFLLHFLFLYLLFKTKPKKSPTGRNFRKIMSKFLANLISFN